MRIMLIRSNRDLTLLRSDVIEPTWQEMIKYLRNNYEGDNPEGIDHLKLEKSDVFVPGLEKHLYFVSARGYGNIALCEGLPACEKTFDRDTPLDTTIKPKQLISSVVSFEELVENGKNDPKITWGNGGSVDLKEIAAIGIYDVGGRHEDPSFSIRLKGGEKMYVISKGYDNLRVLHNELTKIWLAYSQQDKVSPLTLLK